MIHPQLPAYRMDALKTIAGSANRRAFRGSQKRYGHALGVTDSTTSRHFAGDNAPSLRFLTLIAQADKASAFPYIAEAIAIVNQYEIRHATTDQLLVQLNELNDREHTANADSDRATLRAAVNPSVEQLLAAATADVAAGEIALKRAAVLRELAERKRRGE